jgi:acyl carrier protein phosphodiesterase
MNYLFHLFLSDPEPEVMLGNLMGDFVKGRLELTSYPELVVFGLKQHRQVDSFANRSSAYLASRQRIDPHFGYFRSIMIDVFYDHFLACNWDRHHSVALERFAEQIYRSLEKRFNSLPNELQRIVPLMIKHNWLVSYRDIETIQRVLSRLDQRIKRPTPLAQGISQLKQHYSNFETDCEQFIHQAQIFLADKRHCQSGSDVRQ